MELFKPVQSIPNQEVLYFILTVVKDFCAPVRMFSKTWIWVFIQWFSVKVCQSKGIFREMSRYPVKNDTDVMFMQIINHPLEIFRCTVSACRSIIACYLISPGTIKWMFSNTHQFYMCISHPVNILCQLYSNISVIHEAIFIVFRRFLTFP